MKLVSLIYIYLYIFVIGKRSSTNDSFFSDIENIHLATWIKDETYDYVLINENSEDK